MSDWCGYAERQEWWKISIVGMTEEDEDKLIEILQATLPKTERGHGLQTFEGTISPRHASSRIEGEGARLLEKLIGAKEKREQWSRDPFAEPHDYAVSYLKRLGLQYEGWHETFLYFNNDVWVQVLSAEAREIIEIREERLKRLCDLPRDQAIEAYRKLELDTKPWLNVRPLPLLFRLESFEVFTPLWHALNILDWIHFCRDLRLDAEFGDVGFDEKDADLAAEAGVAVGISWQALIGKPGEKHALRGIKVVRAASEGGDIRRGTHAPETKLVLDGMTRMIAEGHTKNSAAAALARRGIGSSATANRAIWYRNKSKKL